MEKPTSKASGRSTTGRAQPLALQGLVNRVVRVLLRTPLLCRAVGKRLLSVYLVGRKSGRHYVVPLSYTRTDDSILIGSEFGWIRNLRTGEPVDIRLQGKRIPADVRVITDEDGVVDHYATLASNNHQWAKFNNITLDQTGNPNVDDLHLAWSAGGRAIVLTPLRLKS
ncbi:MAG: nitroreductase family deazaflavin-dependent oxidoreductase [Kribbellaceae bacterium]|nr:nitroreductase family deazaflavin-dependent oxidoreductase [Catenulispora sp.]NUR96174.1 nitroreductase family deazaflavin-dependent oxidoreductase [Kribbellaceae bacterium]